MNPSWARQDLNQKTTNEEWARQDLNQKSTNEDNNDTLVNVLTAPAVTTIHSA